jgi:hypothetical protein
MLDLSPRAWLVLSGLLAATAPTHADSSRSATARALAGAWRSVAPEPLPGAGGALTYLIREFEFTTTTWHIRFTVYADAGLAVPLFAGDNSGTYVIGAFEPRGTQAQFLFRERSLLPLSQSIADLLTRAHCSAHAWRVGEAQSVFAEGCVAFRVFAHDQCDREYDRVQLEGERLFLGARPADGFMCTPEQRPQEVSRAGLARVHRRAP